MVKKKKTARKTRQSKPKNFNEIVKRLEINEKNIEMIHEDTGKRLKEILSAQAKILDFFKDTKKLESRTNKLADELERFEKALVFKDNTSGTNMKKIHAEIEKEFDRINSVFVKSLDKLKNEIDNVDMNVMSLRQKVNDVKNIEEAMKELDIKAIKREMEVLKTKGEWAEDKINNIDMFPLQQKVTSLERKVRSIRSTAPLIIE
ncbi:MAG: hypothetical protein KKB03_00735 [Nanoarchaeota archaeon]|nr:hypothetical protein [Nanoarchaeota archaeon]MBU1135531.1 hypothetical protein [Nanoarchaeota archaeon]MBU2519755.1 hypothetical protein [Nanoarchaeota archaeon]